jgi:hypothetical protein
MDRRTVLARLGALALLPAPNPSAAQAGSDGFGITEGSDRITITRGPSPVAEYVFRDPRIFRPYFAGLHAPGGVQVSRTHPPVEGKDATDHDTMHPGLWLGFGDLSGSDFWRNKGRIEHLRFSEAPAVRADRLRFATRSRLSTAEGRPLCSLETRCSLRLLSAGFLLTWEAEFRADHGEIVFGDQEEMGFGARVATAITEKAGGLIRSSSGKTTARDTWGQPAAWCDYSGAIDGRPAGITLIPSPNNFRESWWHNRDYGVFVANPFGRAAMKQGEKSSVPVRKGGALRLAFAAVLHAGPGYNPETAYQQYLKAR